jgi:AraC family transcriptional regulator
MRNFYILSAVLDYIEKNICEDFTLDDVAKACGSSLSNLHKLFSYAFGYSVKEYIRKRRHSLACFDLVHAELSILEIAMKYRYNSHEVFVRNFTALRGETPTSYRKNHTLINLYPKLKLDIGGKDMKKVDISELYDTLKNLSGSYVLCADIVHFMEINNRYGFTAGDIVLSKTAERIGKLLGENMFLFRIGKDEFAAVTGLYDKAEAMKLSEEILSHNGEALTVGQSQIPLSLRIGMIKIPDSGLSYDDVLKEMMNAIDCERNKTK